MKRWQAALVAILAGAAVFFPLDYFLTGWDGWFPFVHPFNVLTVALWSIALFLALEKKLTGRACVILAVLLTVSSLPQALFCVLVYSAWIFTAGSVILAAVLLIHVCQLKKRKKL